MTTASASASSFSSSSPSSANGNQAAAIVQSLQRLNLNELTPLSPEVISRQATINIGTASLVVY